jgi:hypothetical protein
MLPRHPAHVWDQVLSVNSIDHLGVDQWVISIPFEIMNIMVHESEGKRGGDGEKRCYQSS